MECKRKTHFYCWKMKYKYRYGVQMQWMGKVCAGSVRLSENRFNSIECHITLTHTRMLRWCFFILSFSLFRSFSVNTRQQQELCVGIQWNLSPLKLSLQIAWFCVFFSSVHFCQNRRIHTCAKPQTNRERMIDVFFRSRKCKATNDEQVYIWMCAHTALTLMNI